MILKVQLTSLHLSSALNSLCPGCRKSNRKWPLPSMMIRPLHTYNSTKITNDLKCHIDRLQGSSIALVWLGSSIALVWQGSSISLVWQGSSIVLVWQGGAGL